MTRRFLLRFLRDIALIPITAFVVYQAMALLPVGETVGEKRSAPEYIVRQMRDDLGFDHRWTTGFLAPWQKLARGERIGNTQPYNARELLRALGRSARVGGLALLLALASGTAYAFLRVGAQRTAGEGVFDFLPSLVYGTPSFILALLFAIRWGVATLPADRPPLEPIAAAVIAIGPGIFLGTILFEALRVEAAKPYLLAALARGRSLNAAIALHALPNALPAVLDALPPVATALVTGSFVAEKLFNLTYFAAVYVDAAERKELALVVVATTVFVTVLIAVSLVAEGLRLLVDPKARARTLESA